MRIYISGAISDDKNYKIHFKQAEDKLKDGKHNYTIINPANLNIIMPQDTLHEEYMNICMELLKMCDCIYMLKGWETSRGANREYGYALAKKMIILRK